MKPEKIYFFSGFFIFTERSILFMNIEGLTLQQVGEKIKEFLPLFIKDTFYLQESYQLEFSEISENISLEYHAHFKENDVLNVSSGSMETSSTENDYNVILVSDENYKTALFLLMQKIDSLTGAEETTLLKSFIY